jgi:hypothetical protein
LKEENFGTLSWMPCPSFEAIFGEAQLGLSKITMMPIHRKHATVSS